MPTFSHHRLSTHGPSDVGTLEDENADVEDADVDSSSTLFQRAMRLSLLSSLFWSLFDHAPLSHDRDGHV